MVWVVSLSTTELISRSLTPAIQDNGIRSLVGFGNPVRPLAHPVLYLPQSTLRGDTEISFGENQLSPGLIGLSPLSTAHPSSFQPTAVRSSTQSYLSFNLAMDRSLGFGSIASNFIRLIQTRFRCGSAISLALLRTITRWLIMQKARGYAS